MAADLSVRVGLLFCVMGLITGSLWARATWGAWWTNDVKLNGAAVSALIYLAYLVLRGSVPEPSKRARLAAIYNIFAFVLLAPWSMILTFPIPLPLPAWVWAFLQLGLTAFGFRSCCEPARREANLAGSAAGLLVAGMVFHQYARANFAWFAGLLAATLLCLWLVRINRAGLPWGLVLRAQFSRSPRPRKQSKPSRKPAKPPPEDIDALLDKISASGLQSLTDEERSRLREYSEKQRR